MKRGIKTNLKDISCILKGMNYLLDWRNIEASININVTLNCHLWIIINNSKQWRCMFTVQRKIPISMQASILDHIKIVFPSPLVSAPFFPFVSISALELWCIWSHTYQAGMGAASKNFFQQQRHKPRVILVGGQKGSAFWPRTTEMSLNWWVIKMELPLCSLCGW